MLKDIKNIAEEMISNGSIEDVDNAKVNILFKFLGYLGYDIKTPLDIVTSPVWNSSGNDCFDYGLVENPKENKLKIVLKVVPFGEDFDLQHDFLEDSFAVNHNFKFAIVTDTVDYAVYQNSGDQFTSVIVEKVFSFSLIDLQDDDMDFISFMSKSSVKKQEFVDDLDENEDLDDRDTKKSKSSKPKKEKKQKKEKKDNSKLKMVMIKSIIMIIGAIAIMAIVNFILTPDASPSGENELPDVSTGSESSISDANIENPNISVGGYTSAEYDIQYIQVNSTLNLNVLPVDNRLSLNLLTTDLPEGTVIKYEIYNDKEVSTVWSKVKKNGESKEYFSIPESWYHPDIFVVVFMPFNDNKNPQPAIVKEQYGDDGEFIIREKGSPKYGLTYGKITHQNQAVIDYLDTVEAERLKKLAMTREKDLTSIETRIDVEGNIKHVPKTYSLSKDSNIADDINIYPEIIYNAKENKSYFNIVAGYRGDSQVNLKTVSFNGDGQAWTYKVGSIHIDIEVAGRTFSEHLRFNQSTQRYILNDMLILANSQESIVAFNGNSTLEHLLSEQEKANIKKMLYIYDAYYGNGTTSPEPKWFLFEDALFDLDFIKTPSKILYRHSNELNSINVFKNELNEKVKNNEEISEDEKGYMEQMNRTYKVMTNNMKDEFVKSLKNTTGKRVYQDNKEFFSDWYLVYYLDYNKEGSIDDGYIPYITVFSDRTVRVPLKVEIDNSDKYTKYLVEYKLSPEMFDKLLDEHKDNLYKQIEE